MLVVVMMVMIMVMIMIAVFSMRVIMAAPRSVDMALGGSSNSVLHLLAIAHEAGVPLPLSDFDRLSRHTPQLTSE